MELAVIKSLFGYQSLQSENRQILCGKIIKFVFTVPHFYINLSLFSCYPVAMLFLVTGGTRINT